METAMKVPFAAHFLGSAKIYIVVAVTDTSAGRFYWAHTDSGELVPAPAWAFAHPVHPAN